MNSSNEILFLHAFSYCSIIPAFRGKGKKLSWQTYDVNVDIIHNDADESFK